jgi:hypothetical protein
MLTNILVNFQAYRSNTFELCMNKLKIADYTKSRAITLTKLKKSTCKIPGA